MVECAGSSYLDVEGTANPFLHAPFAISALACRRSSTEEQSADFPALFSCNLVIIVKGAGYHQSAFFMLFDIDGGFHSQNCDHVVCRFGSSLLTVLDLRRGRGSSGGGVSKLRR